jgi:hypothetical protein
LGEATVIYLLVSAAEHNLRILACCVDYAVTQSCGLFTF